MKPYPIILSVVALSVLALGLIITSSNPFEAGVEVKILFFAFLCIGLGGIFSLLFQVFNKKPFGVAFRRGYSSAIALVGILALYRLGYLTPIVVVSVILIVVLIEIVFSRNVYKEIIEEVHHT